MASWFIVLIPDVIIHGATWGVFPFMLPVHRADETSRLMKIRQNLWPMKWQKKQRRSTTMDNTSKWPLKKFHRISNRTFVVIDESLVKRLSINEDSAWVEQQATEVGILLKVHHFDAEKNNARINSNNKDRGFNLDQ
jgi:hypothetical protein